MASIVRMKKEESRASIADADQLSIAAFIERVWSEDGLADRTLEAYRRDLPDAEIHILDAGHFALDEATDDIARLTRDFLGRHVR